MRRRVKRLCSLAVVVALLNTAACGYLIYPERQGLRGDRVDGTVVALDAVGLLFFILPGVVAFAVDFASGCIYLPQGQPGSFSMNTQKLDAEGWVAVARVPPFADDATIAAALRKYLQVKYLQVSKADTAAARIEWLQAPAPAYAVTARAN